MKKTILLLFALLIIPSVFGIGLVTPPQRTIIFEPNQQVSLQYAAGNTNPDPLTIDIVVTAGILQQYVTSQETMIVPPFSTQPFKVDINFPNELASGIYKVRVEVSEHKSISGMGGITGTADIVDVISPYAEGYPYAEILINKYQKVNSPLAFFISVQNIGKTPLPSVKADVGLKQNDNVLQKITTQAVYLPPFQKERLKVTFENKDIMPGMYTIEADLGKSQTSKEIAIGQPKVTVTNIPVIKAGQKNEFDMTINIDDWSTPIQDAYIQFGITSLFSSEDKMTLNPGSNIMHVSADAKSGKSGTYPGRITVYGPFGNVKSTFQATVEGTAESSGGFGFRKQNQNELAGEAAKAENEANPSKSKNNIFLIGVLIASLLVFAFAIGRYLGRKGKNDGPQVITAP